MLSSFFVFAALLVAPVLAQTPPVTLLTDLKKYPAKGAVSIKPILTKVSKRKGGTFHFGSTYDVFSNQAVKTNFTDVVYSTVYNHVVAENGCKWYDTEQTRGVPSLDDCLGVQAYAKSMGNTFRGSVPVLLPSTMILTNLLRSHNLFWHQQQPQWLPGNVTAPDLVNNVIPQHVKQTIKGLGK
jgi:endo-1,4-beta-xylanase